MSLKPVKTTNMLLTKKASDRFLDWNTYSGQRGLKMRKVAWLLSLVRDKKFTKAQIALANFNGEQVLMNGQHCCTMVNNLPGNQSVPATVDYYKVKSRKELRDLFGTFDNPHTNRTQYDIVRSYAESSGLAQRGWPIDCVRVCTTALGFIEYRDTGEIVTNTDKTELMDTYPNECQFVYDMFFNTEHWTHNRMFINKGVVAAMIETYRRDQAAATKFWSRVRDGEMLGHSAPELKYRNWLTRITTAATKRTMKYRLNPRHVYAYAVLCWNAKRRNKRCPSFDTVTIKAITAELPEVL